MSTLTLSGRPLVTETLRPGSLWAGRDLLGLDGLPGGEIRALLRRACDWRDAGASGPRPLVGRTLANLFFEDSTRTRLSFTAAAQRLGAAVLDLASGASSVNKGESLIDTALTVEAMGVDAMIVRARPCGAAHDVAGAVACPVVNAGDGRHEHPTQGLLDCLTIADEFGRLGGFDLSGLTAAIVGDVANSRVARSAIFGLRTLGARVVCVGPPGLAPLGLATLGCAVERDFDGVIEDADAVMMLRVQFERHDGEAKRTESGEPRRSTAIASAREFREFFGMTEARAARMKPGAIVMHPGPMNRGLEIDAAVADGPRSRITRQVANGVFVRMAVLSECVSAARS